MAKQFSDGLLYKIRNEIPLEKLLVHILKHPYRCVENYVRFLCPRCHGFDTSINPRNNLARCFACKENFNTIDFTIILKNINFAESIAFLRTLIEENH